MDEGEADVEQLPPAEAGALPDDDNSVVDGEGEGDASPGAFIRDVLLEGPGGDDQQLVALSDEVSHTTLLCVCVGVSVGGWVNDRCMCGWDGEGRMWVRELLMCVYAHVLATTLIGT